MISDRAAARATAREEPAGRAEWPAKWIKQRETAHTRWGQRGEGEGTHVARAALHVEGGEGVGRGRAWRGLRLRM